MVWMRHEVCHWMRPDATDLITLSERALEEHDHCEQDRMLTQAIS
jgi:hypothetical protein